jgi:hypothetical protein
MMASQRLRASALLVLVAGAAFVAGIAADRVVFTPTVSPDPAPEGRRVILRGDPDAGPRPPGLRAIRLGLPDQLAEELDLTPEQRERIERILAEDQAALRAVMEQMEPALAEVIENSRQRIQEVLTDEQAARWRESQVIRLRPGTQEQPLRR